MKLPFEGPRFVVKALFSPDRSFSARVDHTYPPTGETLFDTMFSAATVVVYENNRPFDTLRYTHNNIYESTHGRKPRRGAAYRLHLAAPGFPDAISRNEVVPPALSAVRAALDKSENYVINLDLQNLTDQSNKYNIQITGLYEGRRVQLLVEDLLRPDGLVDNCGFRRDNETFFYQDACYANRRLTARFSSSLIGVVPDFFNQSDFTDPTRQSDQVRLQIRSITDSYWNYYHTLPNNEGIEQAFLQPNTRYSNVEGGYGIVAAYQEQVILLDVTP